MEDKEVSTVMSVVVSAPAEIGGGPMLETDMTYGPTSRSRIVPYFFLWLTNPLENSQLGFAKFAGDAKDLDFLVSSMPVGRVIEDLVDFGGGGVDLAPLVFLPLVASDDLTKVLYPGQPKRVLYLGW